MFDGEVPHDAFVTGFADGAWWIVGREEVAELYGVYRTLEQQLGVRWFKPWQKDDPGEYVPRSAKVELPDEMRTYSGEYVIRPGEWVSISLGVTAGSEAMVDDVAVRR